jgi:hypothetical protein
MLLVHQLLRLRNTAEFQQRTPARLTFRKPLPQVVVDVQLQMRRKLRIHIAFLAEERILQPLE